MSAGAYISRVGGLAVALGVGAAAITAYGAIEPASPVRSTPRPAVELTASTAGFGGVNPFAAADAASVANLGTIIEALIQAFGESASNVATFLVNQPAVLTAVVRTAIDDPTKIPGLASFLIHNLVGVNPPDQPPTSLMALAIAPFVIALVTTLPPPIGGESGAFINAMVTLNVVIRSVLDLLPEPVSPFGTAATNATGPATVTNVVTALLQAVGDSVSNVASFVADQPAVLQAVVRTAIDDPTKVPGLASFLVHNLVGVNPPDQPPTSLMARAIAPFVVALATTLPAPIGGESGAFINAMVTLNGVIRNVLAVLPTPVTPSTAQAFSVADVESTDPAGGSNDLQTRRVSVTESAPDLVQVDASKVDASTQSVVNATGVSSTRTDVTDASQSEVGKVPSAVQRVFSLPANASQQIVRSGVEIGATVVNAQSTVTSTAANAEESVPTAISAEAKDAVTSGRDQLRGAVEPQRRQEQNPANPGNPGADNQAGDADSANTSGSAK